MRITRESPEGSAAAGAAAGGEPDERPDERDGADRLDEAVASEPVKDAERPRTPRKGAVARRRAGADRSERTTSPRALVGPLRQARLPLAIALVMAAAGGVLTVLAAGRDDGSPAANRALLDGQATTKVSGDVSNALAKIYSYAYTDLGSAEKAAREVLEGKAARDYALLFTKVKEQAPAQKVTLATRVVRVGVVRLTGDTAQALAFLDQVSTRDNKPTGGIAAQLSVTARLRDGQWRITDIRRI